MAPFARSYMNIMVIWKYGLEVTKGHWNWYHSKAPVINVALSCIVCEIKWVIGQKSQNFYTPPVFSTPQRGDRIGISRRYLILVKLEWLCCCVLKKLWRYV